MREKSFSFFFILNLFYHEYIVSIFFMGISNYFDNSSIFFLYILHSFSFMKFKSIYNMIRKI